MTETIEVRIPQETVNDEVVLVQQWRVSNGEFVSKGQILAEVETSKSVFEITSPASGIVELKVQQGREAAVGETLCLIRAQRHEPIVQMSAEGGATEQPSSQTNTSGTSLVPDRTTRFSQSALNRLRELGRGREDFAGRGLVRLRDVESSQLADDLTSINRVAANSLSTSLSSRATLTRGSQIPAASNWKSATGVTFDSSELSRSKKLETRLLSWSSLQAIRSTISVFVPTVGLNVLRAVFPDFNLIASAHIISAAARLLREFPAFNACCLNEEVRYYREVHAGFAVDAGHGLKVAVIRSADTLVPEQVREARDELIAAYLENRLLPEQLNGATFTISDLSGSGVSTFDPLISEGQSAILGIGSETGEAIDQKGYQLILSFDHRLAEGRLAALFLNRIREQMILFEREMLEKSSRSVTRIEPKCSRCGMTATTAAQRQHYLTEVLVADWSRRLLCTICLQGR